MDDAAKGFLNAALVFCLAGVTSAVARAWVHFGDLPTLAKALLQYCLMFG